jgi:hypothetical protein
MAMALGIMADYLMKKGYKEAGNALARAGQIRIAYTNSETTRIEAAKIHQTLQALNQPILLSLNCVNHVMGLQMVQTIKGFVDFEVYNTGSGIRQYHQQHPHKLAKFQTAWKKRVPLKHLTQDRFKKIFRKSADVNAVYRIISALPEAQDIPTGEKPVIWQSAQKGNNCTLMWIFAYLKNNMPPKEYATMRKQLFTDCIAAGEKARVPNELLEHLRTKERRLAAKLEAIV